jgi:hypothetical protein
VTDVFMLGWFIYEFKLFLRFTARFRETIVSKLSSIAKTKEEERFKKLN